MWVTAVTLISFLFPSSVHRERTEVSRTQKSRWSCYFPTQRWTIYNLRLTQKKGLEKERWHFVVTLTVTHLRQLYNFRISTSQNIHKSCDFQTESRFILFSTFCSSGAAQRPQKVKCVVRLWHQVVLLCTSWHLPSLARDDSHSSSRRRFITF